MNGRPAASASPPLHTLARHELRRWMQRARRHVQRRAFIGELQRWHDALRGTPLAGHYWIVGGLLLGWARERRPLAADLHDADFAYLDEDHERFLASVPALVAAGFTPRHRFTSRDGRHVEHRFRREGIHFELFRLTPHGTRWRYSMFELGERPTELIAEVPIQPRVPIRFLDRTWLKVADHELALRTIYGEWRVDQPGWTFTCDRAIVERRSMPCLEHDWSLALRDGVTKSV
jgi:hypothetical protein